MPETLFLSVADIRRLISAVGLESFSRELGQRLIDDFKRWPEFEKSSRVASYSHSGVIELMPTADGRRFSFKFVNGHPQNKALGLPTVMGFGCLADVDTGYPILLSEMTILTAIRTAATSAVAAMSLANPSAEKAAFIGNGAQSEFQVLAFNAILGIEEFTLFDIDPQASQRLVRNLSSRKQLSFTVSDSVEAAIADCGIITTATAKKRHQHVLTEKLVQSGVHINAIGGDCPGKTELDPNILEASQVFVEFTPQARIEGEIQQMSPDFKVTELWEVFSGVSPGRISETSVTVFDSVGFSIEDFSVLNLVYDLAHEHGLGNVVELVPDLADAKDLFSCLPD